ncbi:MAG: hypothetical protein ACRDZ6_06560 [Acidimicrobiales bacterium]
MSSLSAVAIAASRSSIDVDAVADAAPNVHADRPGAARTFGADLMAAAVVQARVGIAE